MELLRNLSIRWKVIHMIMFTMTVALLAACAAFMTYDYVAFRDLQIEDSQTLADMLGTGSTAALTFDDAGTMRETLQSLATKRDVTQARVYAASGREFAAYRRAGVPPSKVVVPPGGYGTIVTPDRIGVFRPIVLNGE